MKGLFLVSICFATISFTAMDYPNSETPKSRNALLNVIDWKGKYDYVLTWENGFINYTLTIGDADACLIEADGYMTAYKILCVGRNKGDQYEIYFFKSIGDEPIGFNTNTHDGESPLLKLYYKNDILYTIDDGFLEKNIEHPTKRLFNKTESQDDPSAPADTNRRY